MHAQSCAEPQNLAVENNYSHYCGVNTMYNYYYYITMASTLIESLL